MSKSKLPPADPNLLDEQAHAKLMELADAGISLLKALAAHYRQRANPLAESAGERRVCHSGTAGSPKAQSEAQS